MFTLDKTKTSFGDKHQIIIYDNTCPCRICKNVYKAFLASDIKFYKSVLFSEYDSEQIFIYGTKEFMIAAACLLFLNAFDYPRYKDVLLTAYLATELSDPTASAETAQAIYEVGDRVITRLIIG